MTVPSPCVHICVVEPRSGFCRGCLRTLPEIAGWSRAEDSRRLEILERIKDRSIPKD